MAHSTYIFAGGGTGGHIFPALAIAEQIVPRDPSATFHFIVSNRALDREIMSTATIGENPASFTASPAQPFVLRPKPLAKFLWHWGDSVRHCRQCIANARSQGPVAIIALGGFVAAPAAQAARASRVPLLLINLDAVPGKANRWIAARATTIATAAPVDAPFASSWISIPPIVRWRAMATNTTGRARSVLGLDPSTRTLLITGGSQGAGSINNLMLHLVQQRPHLLAGWQVLHQTGKDAPPQLADAYAAANIRAIVTPFVDRLGYWWNAASLAIARSGAGNVAEAWANGIPALFLPYPYHKDEHQRLNALPIERAGGAVIAKDHIDAARNLAAHESTLTTLLTDTARLDAMRESLIKLGPADGAERAATLAMQVLA
jgi:UDP-N-acetylglucosamine--N-acetylmuramyl-(pentapeptide) pyrophosphoryl-undecaprenol N-acetylglucosamine transferase